MDDQELEEIHEQIFSRPKKRDDVDLDEQEIAEHAAAIFGERAPIPPADSGEEEPQDQDLEEREATTEDWADQLFEGGV